MAGVEEPTGDKEPKQDSHSSDTNDSPPRVSQDTAQRQSVQHQTSSHAAKRYIQGRQGKAERPQQDHTTLIEFSQKSKRPLGRKAQKLEVTRRSLWFHIEEKKNVI